MSLLPYLFDDSDLWAPSLRCNRNRGWLENFVEPNILLPRRRFDIPDVFRNLNASLQDDAKISMDTNKFRANFDVQHFKPEEVSVKVNEGDKTVIIEGKHEEKTDEHGQIYRHFVRKYALPKDCDIKSLESKLSSDGVLSITAPRLGQHQPTEDHRSIPIIRTGQPAKSIEQNSKKMETQ